MDLTDCQWDKNIVVMVKNGFHIINFDNLNSFDFCTISQEDGHLLNLD